MILVIDSSAWIELLEDSQASKEIHKEMIKSKKVIVPTIVIYEVYKKTARILGEDQALRLVAQLSQHSVEDLNREIALLAGDLSLKYKLPMADSFVLAHAVQNHALLLTLDNDFQNIPQVKIIAR